MSHDDFKFEPQRGLPELLPAGEHIVWQGGPKWGALARHVFHVRFVAAYFALIVGWRVVSGLEAGVATSALAVSVLWTLGLGALAIGVLALIAWGYGRMTVYTITNRRIVIRSGVAFQVTFNLPFDAITGAGFKTHRDGTGDIPIELDGSAHIAYLHIWPNVRPWHFTKVQPMLRNVADADRVAEHLKSALLKFHGGAAARASAAKEQPAIAAFEPRMRPAMTARTSSVMAAE